MAQGKHLNIDLTLDSYTKMGYAGNMEPSYLIPTVIADSLSKVQLSLLSVQGTTKATTSSNF